MTFAERIKQVVHELGREGAADREVFAQAWIHETGLKPSESVMHEQIITGADGSIERRVWFSKREEAS